MMIIFLMVLLEAIILLIKYFSFGIGSVSYRCSRKIWFYKNDYIYDEARRSRCSTYAHAMGNYRYNTTSASNKNIMEIYGGGSVHRACIVVMQPE